MRNDRAWTAPHTKDELNRVAVLAQSGDERAKRQLAKMMRPYVVAMTRKYDGLGGAGDGYSREDSDDLKQAIWMGVWLALDGFDPDQAKFNTYAWYYMRREAFQWMAKHSRALPMSRRAWEQSRRLAIAFEDLYPDRDIMDATDEELAELEISDTDDKSKTRTISHAGDILRAKQASREIDPELDARSSQSAEADFFEERFDMDADALETIERMRELDLEEAYWEAMAFCNRHDLSTAVADRMMEEMT